MRAYIGLGSNLGDGPTVIRKALAELDQHDAIQILRHSSLYTSAPWGHTEQADFTNSVAEINTDLSPDALLGVLLDTEQTLGRERNAIRWGPRIIDLDLLCCGQLVSRRPDLEVPHPRMHQRAFVMVPLLELEPNVLIPGIGSAQACLDGLKNQIVKRLE